MVNYSNTKIYYILVGNERYYGHTTQKLCERKGGHKRDFHKHPNAKLYKTMRDAGMTENDIQLVLVEDFPCERKEQAEARERYYIEQYATLNMVIPTRTRQEYRNVNSEMERERRAKWKTENPKKVREIQAKWYIKNADKVRERMKTYRAENVGKIRERKAQYRAENKDILHQKYELNKDKYNATRREKYALKKAQQQSS